MIYPIVAYGDPVLKKVADPILQNSSVDVVKLAADMFETMYEANGVGLAAPQIGMSIRMFVVDAEGMDEENLKGFKKVFINPTIEEEFGEEWAFEEGCLSIPGIRDNVYRKPNIKISYFDELWQPHTDLFDGLKARVIQHEYDHIQGVLFTDHISSLKKQLIKNKLHRISKGDVKHDYRMRFPDTKR